MFALGHLGTAQTKIGTETGLIRFNASTPLEDILATNNEVNVIIDTSNGKIAALLLIRDFQFRRKLMQEHFNENYLESERYPKSYFQGQIMSFDPESLSETPSKYNLEGQMTIHGVSRKISVELYLHKALDSINLESRFVIRPEDYNIEVPKLLFTKIAQEVEVQLQFTLKAK